jgi:hypothetical protein
MNPKNQYFNTDDNGFDLYPEPPPRTFIVLLCLGLAIATILTVAAVVDLFR